MAIVPVILGLAAGLLGITVSLGIDITGSGTTMTVPLGELLPFRVLSIVAPIVSLLGGAFAKPTPMIGGALMLIGAAGMVLSFQLNSVSAIPIALSTAGVLAAFWVDLSLPSAKISGR